MFYLLYLLSGAGGAILEVAWARQYGAVFGNTAYSTLLSTTVFLLGWGAGGYLCGAWSDRRHAAEPSAVLTIIARVQLASAALGLLVSVLLPNLGVVSSLTAFYSRTSNGWYSLSLFSSLIRDAIAVILLSPSALLMGASLILAIRHLVQRKLSTKTPRIALFYGVVFAGAAAGAFAMDFTLVKTIGLRGAELLAVLLHVVAGFGALRLAAPGEEAAAPAPTADVPVAAAVPSPPPPAVSTTSDRERRGRGKGRSRKNVRAVEPPQPPLRDLPWTPAPNALALTSWALALFGFAAMGLALVWFRQFTLLLGGFRAVFSLLLTVILAGIGTGATVGGIIGRYSSRPAHWLVGTIGLFVAAALVGLATADVQGVLIATNALSQAPDGGVSLAGTSAELWLNLRPILLEVGPAALLIGLALPLAHASVLGQENATGQRAGSLHAAFALGAACGVVVTGVLLRPGLGVQATATVLAIAGVMAIVPLGFASRARARGARTPWPVTLSLACSTLLALVAVGFWMMVPANVMIAQSTAGQGPTDRLLSLQEGVEAVVAVTEVPDKGRWLLTDGSPLSAANRMSRRSARALAYIPLLMSERPESVLVVGFGVGHTGQAAVAYPTVRRVEIVDPSGEVLAQAGYFKDANGSVLSDRKVSVYVNDGRQHLRMQPAASYDLIALEPPFLSLAGTGALYSREFYALARTRLKPKGYLSQPLPIYQVSAGALLNMVRAFVDVFPRAVLLGGTGQELMLVGVNDSRLEVDPDQLMARLTQASAAQTDLQALNLSGARDVLGTFVASGQTLSSATRDVRAASDDRPMQEYAASSRLTAIHLGGVPAALVDPGQVSAWCPRCYAAGAPVKTVEGLGAYIALLEPLYKWTLPPVEGPGSPADAQTQEIIRGSAYVRDLIAEHVARRNARGAALATDGRLDEAIEEFRNVLRLDPDSAHTHWNLGRALASRGQIPASVAELRRSVELDPNQGPPHYDLASTLLDLDQVDGAIDEFRAAIRLMPKAVEAHNNLGIALGRKGRLEEAVNEFQEALKLNPDYAEAQHNLSSALQAVGSANPGRGAR